MKAVIKKRNLLSKCFNTGFIMLAMLVVMAWIASLSWYICAFIQLPFGRKLQITVVNGGLYIGYGIIQIGPPANWLDIKPIESWHQWFIQYGNQIQPANWFQFDLYRVSQGWVFEGPIWSLFTFLIIAWLVSRQILRYLSRRPENHCSGCGYDLHGSIESTSCPECGESINREYTQVK